MVQTQTSPLKFGLRVLSTSNFHFHIISTAEILFSIWKLLCCTRNQLKMFGFRPLIKNMCDTPIKVLLFKEWINALFFLLQTKHPHLSLIQNKSLNEFRINLLWTWTLATCLWIWIGLTEIAGTLSELRYLKNCEKCWIQVVFLTYNYDEIEEESGASFCMKYFSGN